MLELDDQEWMHVFVKLNHTATILELDDHDVHSFCYSLAVHTGTRAS